MNTATTFRISYISLSGSYEYVTVEATTKAAALRAAKLTPGYKSGAIVIPSK